MSDWWKTAKDILKGKPKGSKLIILGVFLVGIGVTIHIATGNYAYASPLEILGMFSFGVGLGMYKTEAEYEMERKRQKE
jgi:hypothetical protein